MAREIDKISILIPDGESHALVYIVNCLRSKGGVRIHVMSSQRSSPLQFSRYVKTYSYYPDNDQDSKWIQNINNEVDKHGIDVIMPIWEFGIERILQNKHLLTNPEKLTILPEIKSFDIASDKWNLYEHLTEFSIHCPNTILFSGIDRIEDFEFPLLTKPTKNQGGGLGIQLICNLQDLQKYFETNDFRNHTIILQEFIEGTDYTVSTLCIKGEILAYTIQRSRDIPSNKFGPQMHYQFEQNDELLNVISRLMKTLSWSGIASVDVRYDLKEQKYKILEINPRFWRSVYGSLYAGINFPHLLVQLTCFGKIEKGQSYQNIPFFDLKGFVQAAYRKPAYWLNFRVIKNNTPLSLVFSDPFPYVYKFIWRSKNILLSKLKIKKGE
jgi:predicted ATP-grasp superfamily ATP-dependent carboligase